MIHKLFTEQRFKELASVLKGKNEGRKETFYLTTHSTHFYSIRHMVKGGGGGLLVVWGNLSY